MERENGVALRMPGGNLLKLTRRGRFAAPHQQRSARKEFRAQLNQRLRQHIHPPAFLHRHPGREPDLRRILMIPADHQRVVARLFPCGLQTKRDLVNQNAVEQA